MLNQLLIFRTLTVLGQLGLLWAGDWFGFTVDNDWVWCAPVAYLSLVYGSYFLKASSDFSKSLLVVDLAAWIVFFALLDGVSNPLIWCLMLPIMLAGLSQSIGFTWIMTLLSNLSYVVLWVLTPMPDTGMHNGHEPFNAHVLGMWVGFVLISNLLTYITTQLMKTIHDKNRQLLAIEQQRAEDQHIMTMATMATGLAHELGSPLNSIKLLAAELSSTMPDKKTLQADLTVIDEQVARCQSTIREMVDLANDPDYLNSQVTDLKTLMDDMISRFRQNHPDIAVSITGETHQSVMTDALLQLALLNILNNSAAAQARQITIMTKAKANQTEMSIRDNGLGSQFNQGSGLGIGLKLSRRILRSAGGTLAFKRHQHGAETLITLARIES
ncbi:MAG: sensor histidine kinase [Proteobacteria bacterium]|nr:MAG: sensor histidine kinase [Pseudomonadota bacterium]